MEEIKAVREQLSASFLDAYLRFQKLNEEIDHSAGTIVWKGPKNSIHTGSFTIMANRSRSIFVKVVWKK